MGEGKKTNLIGSILFLLPGIHLLFVLFNLQAFFFSLARKGKGRSRRQGLGGRPED